MTTWDRPTLKNFAKEEMRISFWMSFFVCLVGNFLGNVTDSVDTHFDTYGNIIGRTYNFGSLLGIIQMLIPWAALGALVSLIYIAFVSGPINVGICRYFTQAPKGDRQFANLFWGFGQSGHYMNIVITMIVFELIIAVGFVLLIVPGIIFLYMYRMVPYILAQNPGMRTVDVLRLSADMTRGDKMNMFVLDLSFIGWYLALFGVVFVLAILSIIPGFIFIMSILTLIAASAISIYIHATYAQLYGALCFKVTGTDPYSRSGGGGGYPPGGGSYYPPQGGYPPGGTGYPPQGGGTSYQWGGQQHGDYNPPPPSSDQPHENQQGQGYNPPPPPPYGRHTQSTDDQPNQPPDQNPT